MRDPGQLYFATNKEIHDLLFSAKQKVTEAVLLELLRDRGIFCSPAESREALVQYLSLLPHDYADVCGVLERRETSKRGEKTATISLNTELSPDELKEIVSEYQKAEVQEIVRSHKKSESEFVMSVTYSEFDYSKTRLLQRQDRDAELVFTKIGGRTEIRIPATDRARAMVDKLRERIEAHKKAAVQIEEIELTGLTLAEARTTFFTRLISSLPDFPLMTVSRLRVAHSPDDQEDDTFDMDGDEVDDAEEKMLGVVENVALSGENLVASEMYQELKDKGFFITSITWRAKQKGHPYAIIECDAGFEDRQAGKKFRYSVHGALKFKNGAYTKNIRPVSEAEKSSLLAMIETTARAVLAQLIAEADAGADADAETTL
jgi:hypothetical protein